MKKIIYIPLVVIWCIFSAWKLWCGHLWSEGWKHYEKGGGVFVGATVVESEMRAAHDEFERLARWNPVSVKGLNYQGKTLIFTGEYELAIEIFNKSIGRRSNFTAHYRKAFALMKLERYTEMIQELKSAEKYEGRFSSVVRFREEFGHLSGQGYLGEFEGH